MNAYRNSQLAAATAAFGSGGGGGVVGWWGGGAEGGGRDGIASNVADVVVLGLGFSN